MDFPQMSQDRRLKTQCSLRFERIQADSSNRKSLFSHQFRWWDAGIPLFTTYNLLRDLGDSEAGSMSLDVNKLRADACHAQQEADMLFGESSWTRFLMRLYQTFVREESNRRSNNNNQVPKSAYFRPCGQILAVPTLPLGGPLARLNIRISANTGNKVTVNHIVLSLARHVRTGVTSTHPCLLRGLQQCRNKHVWKLTWSVQRKECQS